MYKKKTTTIAVLYGSILSILISIAGCSNEIKVIGDWEDIPVVYGLLERNQDSYIQIQRAFLPPNTDALEVAQIEDSLYYKEEDIDVLLYENGTFFDTLHRIDLDTIGMPKDSGIFAFSSNYAYIIEGSMEYGRTYELQIINKVTGKTTIASTTMLTGSQLSVVTPNNNTRVRWAAYQDNGVASYQEVPMRWDKADNANIYDLTIRIHYQEYKVDLNVTGEPEIVGTREDKYLDWTPLKNFVPEDTVSSFVLEYIGGERFYQFLAGNLSDLDGTDTRRCLGKLDVFVDAGGEEIADYIAAQNANDGLIGGLYPIEPYSNIQGGYGLFSSRFRREKLSINMHPDVFEFLATDETTRSLRFDAIECAQ